MTAARQNSNGLPETDAPASMVRWPPSTMIAPRTVPVLRTRKMLARLASGDRLIVECTDPLAAIDVPHSAFENGGALESRSEADGVMRFLIRRRAA